MDKLKELLTIETSIYQVYETMSLCDDESIKSYIPLLKMLGYKKERLINNLTVSELSQFIFYLNNNIEHNLNTDLMDIIYFPVNEEPEDLITTTLVKDLSIKQAMLKSDSSSEEISSYYTNEYYKIKSNNYYNCLLYLNVLDLSKEFKNEIYMKDLLQIIYMQAYKINSTLYKSLCKNNSLDNIELDDMSNMEYDDVINPITPVVLEDLIIDGIELETDIYDDIDNADEELKEKTEELKLQDSDPLFYGEHHITLDIILPYFLDIRSNQYKGADRFCALVCFNQIKTYSMLNFDNVNRKQLIKEAAEKHKHYHKEGYENSSKLIDSLFERPKKYIKNNK